MSEITDALGNVLKRRPGRPRKNLVDPSIVESVAATQEVSEPEPSEIPEIDDSQLEDFDLGDIAARDSWTPLSGKPFARRGSYAATISHLPDLNPPGTLVNRHDPTKQYQRGWLEEDGSRHARQVALQIRSTGWRPAMAGDFIVCPELREFITADDSGRLVYADMNGKTAAILIVRDQAAYTRARKELTRLSDGIQLSVEEKAAQLQENLRRQGMSGVTATATLTDDY